MTIAQRNSKQNQNKIAAQNRAKAMAKDNIQKFGGTASAAAANKQAMVDRAKVRNNPTQGKPMPSNPAGMRQQAVGGGQQAAPKKQGLLGRIGSGIKRVAGGVADAATGNRFDFDKRGGQRPPRPAGQAAGGAVASRPAGQSAAGGASATRKIDGAGLANTMRAQNNQSGGQRRPVSPQMQQKLNRIGVGKRAAQAVQKLNPQPGQTVTTKQNAQGGTTATLTGGTGSVSGNVNKAKRIVKNQNVGPTTVGKITGGQGVSDF